MTDVNVNVYLGKPMLRSDGMKGTEYTITIYPAPENNMRIAEIITDAIKKEEVKE